MRVLILCTGNSCRSQMAEAFLTSLDPTLHVFSAGTHPSGTVHPLAVMVMKEAGIDISSRRPKNVDQFVHDSFDYVITICNNAREECPVFVGKVQHRLHMSFDDPASVKGTQEYVRLEFRRVRDAINTRIQNFYTSTLMWNGYIYGTHL